MHISQIPRYPVTIDGETTHIGTANELAIALDVLQGQCDRAILEQLRPHLADIVGGPMGLTNVMRSLETENQIFLIDAIGGKLASVLQQSRYLRDLLAMLAGSQVEQKLIDTLGTDGLRAIIITPEELAEVVEWIYGANDHHLIDLLGADYVRHIIRTGDELSRVLHGLEAAAQADLIEKIGWTHIVELVRDGRDLAYLMRALPASLSAPLLKQFSRSQLVDLIGNKLDWSYLYERLEPSEARDLIGVIQNAE
ncbi:MAG: hypothetical protein HZB51_18385 [Chloroflexi bacterium]|nr:hypothetical protein [Chloroflexota bacterium]